MALQHREFSCSECGEAPIQGCRWRCASCPGLEGHSLCTRCLVHLSAVPTADTHAVSAVATAECLAAGRCSVADGGVALGLALPEPGHPDHAICPLCSEDIVSGNGWASLDFTDKANSHADTPMVCTECVSETGGEMAMPHYWVRVAQPTLCPEVEEVQEALEEDEHGVDCDVCGASIVGPRWECTVCEQFDLCWACASTGQLDGHPDDHEFVLCRELIVTLPALFDSVAAIGYDPGLLRSPADPTSTASAALLPVDAAPAAVSVDRGESGVDTAVAQSIAMLGRFRACIPDHLAGFGDEAAVGRGLAKHVGALFGLEFGSEFQESLSAADSVYKALNTLEEGMKSHNPRFSIAVSIAAECVLELVQPHAPFDEGEYDYLRVAELGRQVFEAVPLPWWVYDTHNPAVDFSAVVPAIVACAYKESGLYCADVSGHSSRETESRPAAITSPTSTTVSHKPLSPPARLHRTTIGPCSVYTVRYSDVLRVVQTGARIPEFHECTLPATDDERTPAIRIFLSHRWKHPDHPDLTGEDWKLAESTVEQLIGAVVQACSISLGVLKLEPSALHAALAAGSQEGFGLIDLLPHSHLREGTGPLIDGALINDVFMACLAVWQPDLSAVTATVLESVTLWYDYTCLPQTQANETERKLMQTTLRHLSTIQRAMHTLVVSTEADYLSRAWCSAELLNSEGKRSLTCNAGDFGGGGVRVIISERDPADTATATATTAAAASAAAPPAPADGLEFGNVETGELGTKVVRTMINPLVTRPEDVLNALGLKITYAGADSEAVCRTLWAFVCRRFLDQFSLIMFDIAPPTAGGRIDFASRTALDVSRRHGRSALLAVGRTADEACRWLGALDRLPHGWPFDEWLDMRQESADCLAAVRSLPPAKVLKVALIPEDLPRPYDYLHSVRRNLAALSQVVSLLGPTIMRKVDARAITVSIHQDSQSIDYSAPSTVVVGYATSDDPLVHRIANVLLPGPTTVPIHRVRNHRSRVVRPAGADDSGPPSPESKVHADTARDCELFPTTMVLSEGERRLLE